MAEVVFRLSHHLPLQTFPQSMSHAVSALYTPLYATFAQQAVGNRLQHPAQICRLMQQSRISDLTQTSHGQWR